MCQKILIVSRHNFLPEQIRGLQRIHGKNVIIHDENIRFRKQIMQGKKRVMVDDPESLIHFHLTKTIDGGYDFIYYVLSEKLQKNLLKNNLSFGVLERPKVTNFALELKIVHKISLEKTEEKFKRRFERKGSLGFQKKQKTSREFFHLSRKKLK